jgi:membrane fusion protein (multidrug efflux system)
MNTRLSFVMTACRTSLAVAVALSVSSCRQKEVAATAPPPVVQVMTLAAEDAPATAEFIGQLDSPQNVEVRARVEAFVDKVLFTEGTEVKEGDRLFQLDDSPYMERLAAAEGMLAEAKASLNKYEKDVTRLTPLAEKRAVPQQDLDNAIASVAVGEAGVLSAKARVEAAMLDVSYCDVRAPISGLIGAKQVSIGELVGKGEPTLLATMSTLDPIWFYCSISEVDFLRAEAEVQRTGRRVADLSVTLILADGSAHPEKGKFVFIDRAVDPKTGTLRARVEFANPRKVLRPGMFGRISADLGARPNAILVPERAVAELQGKTFVWVIGGDNKASQRPIKTGRPVGERTAVLEGLKAGERIVVEGLQKVREGAPVQPMSAEQMRKQAAPSPVPSEEGAAKHGKE